MKVGLVYDPVYLQHDTGPSHVESSQRLLSTVTLLEENQFINRFLLLSPRPATMGELTLVHAPEYIRHIQDNPKGGDGWVDRQTVISPGSYNAAINAAGGVLAATDAVMGGKLKSAFALVRPPGHHATCWQALGFCIFNNVALAAKHALANFNIQRVMVVDFDAHHGNGTQDTFYADPHVLYFSVHQYPQYPGTGSVAETGTRGGEGFTVNVPLIAGWGDDEYQAVFEDILAPVARRFQPHLMLVSAGYNAHWADSTARMRLSVSGFARLVEIIQTLADMLCQGRMVFALEGGYHLNSLALSIKASLGVLLGDREVSDPLGKKESKGKPLNLHNFIKMVRDIHRL